MRKSQHKILEYPAIFDPAKEWIVGEQKFESKSKNSPFIGWKMKGKATDVLVAGEHVLRDEKIIR